MVSHLQSILRILELMHPILDVNDVFLFHVLGVDHGGSFSNSFIHYKLLRGVFRLG